MKTTTQMAVVGAVARRAVILAGVAGLVSVVPALAMQEQEAAVAPPTLRALYEAGKDQEVLTRVSTLRQESTIQPSDIYLAARSQERLDQTDVAKQTYQELAARPQTDPWHFIGRSGALLLEQQVDAAIAAATEAVALDATLPQAHYQLGLARGHKQDFPGAAPAFVQATTLDPSYAYAHYHAGLSFYRIRRIDLMTRHFEAFVRLAPQAPERGQVESILRTVRG